jgi:hypothetical protein
MSDAERTAQHAAQETEGALFQGQEEQERVHSPQAVPGTQVPPIERDRGGTATKGTAVATDQEALSTWRCTPCTAIYVILAA